MRVRDIAESLGAAFEGDGELEIAAAAALDDAGPADLSFAAGKKAAGFAAGSRAGCLIVEDSFPGGRTLIRARDARASFARALVHLYPARTPPAGVHATAAVDPSAQVDPSCSVGAHVTIGAGSVIGARTVIGAGCGIAENVRLGSDCALHANVTIYAGVSAGDRVVLHSGCVLGADGFGFVFERDHYEKFPQVGRVVIEDDVEIGANSCVDRAALGVTLIGRGTKLDNMVHIGHNCHIGQHVVIAAQTGLSGGVVIEDYAVIGGQVGIGDKARIESRAVLGSGSGVLTSKIVRGGQTYWGTPARPLREYLRTLALQARAADLHEEVADLRRRIAELERGR